MWIIRFVLVGLMAALVGSCGYFLKHRGRHDQVLESGAVNLALVIAYNSLCYAIVALPPDPSVIPTSRRAGGVRHRGHHPNLCGRARTDRHRADEKDARRPGRPGGTPDKGHLPVLQASYLHRHRLDIPGTGARHPQRGRIDHVPGRPAAERRRGGDRGEIRHRRAVSIPV
jgi:hypothetical protein